MKFLTSILLVALSFSGFSQREDLPNDFLKKEFHQERRKKLREKLPPNSVAVFFSNPVRNRANDVNYVYHQSPDFFYFSGYNEPNAVVFIFKDKQKTANGEPYDEIIFVQPNNKLDEMWNGRRLGTKGVKDRLGFDQVFNNTEFKYYDINFSKLDKVLFTDFMNDVRNNPRDSADLFDLQTQFKAKVNYPSKEAIFVPIERQKNNLDIAGLHPIMDELRGIKTPEELRLLRRAVQISCIGQLEVMKAMKPGMSEREVQGIHEFIFKKYQAEDLGYPSIIGAGHNGCILHYIDNYKPSITNKELILMDLGAEFHGYTADITRTIPVSGKFSTEQKLIYEIVLKAQDEAMKICKPGTTFAELTAATRKVVNKGLTELGIIKIPDEKNTYYPHGCCHHIGLDVHDRGSFDKLQENMVITIEPGIYIPEESACDKKWWGIAVRIEDDFLITKTGCEHLSNSAPRTVKEIEETMKLPSALDNFKLPELGKQ